MARIFSSTRKTIVNQVISSGEVTVEKLTYDRPEVHPPATDAAALAIVASEVQPAATEEVVAALLLQAEDVHPAQTDGSTAEPTVTATETHPSAADANAVGIVASETNPGATDTHGLSTHVAETNPAATDAISLSAVVSETHPGAVDENSAVVIVPNEVHPNATDAIALSTLVSEAHPDATDGTTLQATATATETQPVAVEAIATVVSVSETQANGVESVTIEVDIEFLWADVTVSNTGFTSPANAIDKNTTTGADLTATSSGIAGGTSNTTNGNMVVSFPNLAADITNFTITSVTWTHGFEMLTTGTALTPAPAVNMNIRYSVNDGGAFTLQETWTTVAPQSIDRTVDLTSVIGGDWTKINQFRTQWDGSVTSGGGVVSATSRTFRARYTRLRIQANRTY